MARIDNKTLRELGITELSEKLADAQALYKKKQFAHTVSPMDNPLELRYLRRDIARMQTELMSRKKAENKA
jgi:large subunit ribosomal protein L29